MTPGKRLAIAIGVLVAIVAVIVAIVWFDRYRGERATAAGTEDVAIILDAQTKLLRREKLSAAEIADMRIRCKRVPNFEGVCASIEERLTKP